MEKEGAHGAEALWTVDDCWRGRDVLSSAVSYWRGVHGPVDSALCSFSSVSEKQKDIKEGDRQFGKRRRMNRS